MTENSLDTAGRRADAEAVDSERAAPTTVDRPASSGAPTGGGRPPRPTLGRRAAAFADSLWRPALVLAVLFAAWWFVAAQEYVPNYLVPTPGQVWETMTDQWSELARHTLVTLYETVLGFVLAAALGLATAVAIAYSRTLDKALYPIVLFAQVIPKIAIAPLLVVWFGLGLTPKIILAVLIAFFPVVISGVAGLRSTDPELLDLAATMGAGPWRTFRKIRFPNALPHLMAGLKVAVTSRWSVPWSASSSAPAKGSATSCCWPTATSTPRCCSPT